MKKIGILTFHRALNYGALLQTYALQTAIKRMGADVQIIDYKNQVIEELYRYKSFSERKSINEKAKYILQCRQELAKRQRFEDFRRKALNLTPKIYTSSDQIDAEEEGFDYIITGSDQVWNPMAHRFDKRYLLDFVKDDRKKVSYAASFGLSSLNEEYVLEYRRLLYGFPVISVREESGAEIVRKQLGLSARVDVDPTFLLNENEWRSACKGSEVTGNFILLYSFELTPGIKIMAEKLAKKTGLEILYFGRFLRTPFNAKFRYMPYAGPFEFISAFLNARYIVTNSFHGTAFSINFNKEFYLELLIQNKHVNSRLENIIAMTGLETQYINEDGDMERYLSNRIDWDQVNIIMSTAKEDSLQYLRNRLGL